MAYPKRNMSITLTLVIINVIIFMVMLVLDAFSPSAIKYIGLTPSVVLSGKNLWTVFTNMFMHASLSHLFMNMLSLIFLGGFLERILGRKKFLNFYLSAGVFASLFFVLAAFLLKQDLDVTAVGASGAIFGIAGVLAILTPKLPVYIMFIPIAIPMWLASVLILVVMWLLSIILGIPIGNTAHLGGLLSGAIYGVYLKNRYKKKVYLLNRFLMRQY